jgi:phosphatidylserine/phosphatidylglycerophosphate/cardiolipin synthase-like enzyme
LNKYQLYQGQAFQEDIYIHSKILIADGKKAVVGSANLNDRSLLGHRGSEISILVGETLDGEKVGNLLKQLLQEHWNIEIKSKLATTDKYIESLWKLFLGGMDLPG